MSPLFSLPRLLVGVAFLFLTGCLSSSDSSSVDSGETSGASALPVGNLSQINDTARFLAGMPGGGNPRLQSLRRTPGWQAHAATMDRQFRYFDRGYLPKIRSFRPQLGSLSSPQVLFYPFGGPDYLFAHAFFPGARNIVLVGLEGADPLPDLENLSPSQIDAGLGGLALSLKDITAASYFVTKSMRTDLATTSFRGTLPLILVMIARSGQNIQSVTPVGLDASGNLVSRSAGAACPGWQIQVGGSRVFYFQEDLSNRTQGRDRRLPRFVRSMGAPVTFVKSASYLMHTDGFTQVRSFVLEDSQAIFQDPSGVPYRLLNQSDLSLSLYGNYVRPLDIFDEYYQPDLANAYRDRTPHPVRPLDFGVGYLRMAPDSCLIFARR